MSKDSSGTNVDKSLYRSIIGNFLYLTARKPDTDFVVDVCARYQSSSKTSHLFSAKRIIKYIDGTSNYGLLNILNTNNALVGYCEIDWAGSLEDRKSTSEGCFFLWNNLILWFSKKQNVFLCLQLKRNILQQEVAVLN
ncbi:uncharacterized mitochondrial protein AtMg00810-like [Benincasa hispida]|uniref:uncharacterized mitochondrial protein AtMg00810-like n=1 Tax=Benincasa hispida TaxID=102211 RepID=UPI0019020DE8|nr:uncharacterized mitochondrial protein AtMg00810-like [Benincasa hispida]